MSIELRRKPGGDDLVLRGVGQQIAGELLDDELVVRQVAIEGVDDVIAIRPDLARLVLLVAVGVRVTRRVQPVPPPAFAVMRRGEQPLDDFVVSIFGFVGEKCIHVFRRGRQAREIEVQPPQQRDLVRFRRGLEFFLFQSRQHMFFNFCFAAQRAVWLRPQSGANDKRSGGANFRQARTRSATSSTVSM